MSYTIKIDGNNNKSDLVLGSLLGRISESLDVSQVSVSDLLQDLRSVFTSSELAVFDSVRSKDIELLMGDTVYTFYINIDKTTGKLVGTTIYQALLCNILTGVKFKFLSKSMTGGADMMFVNPELGPIESYNPMTATIYYVGDSDRETRTKSTFIPFTVPPSIELADIIVGDTSLANEAISIINTVNILDEPFMSTVVIDALVSAGFKYVRAPETENIISYTAGSDLSGESVRILTESEYRAGNISLDVLNKEFTLRIQGLPSADQVFVNVVNTNKIGFRKAQEFGIYVRNTVDPEVIEAFNIISKTGLAQSVNRILGDASYSTTYPSPADFTDPIEYINTSTVDITPLTFFLKRAAGESLLESHYAPLHLRKALGLLEETNLDNVRLVPDNNTLKIASYDIVTHLYRDAKRDLQ